MSNFKMVVVESGQTPKNVLGSLRDVQIIDSKPVLPAEILSMVLEYVTIPDLIHCACVSKRMREMVYDDTRWVRKLRMMGCWNEAAARARVEQADPVRTEASLVESVLPIEESEGSRESRPGHHAPSLVLPKFPDDANGPSSGKADDQGTKADGFDEVSLSNFNLGLASPVDLGDITVSLEVTKNVRSVRGFARQEYGRLYSVLRPFYKDALRTKHPSNAKIFRTYRDPNQQARMLAQILAFAASDHSQGQNERAQKLATMTAAFEDAVSHEFEQGLKIGDVDGRMNKYANVLVTLNGGARAISKFIEENKVLKNEVPLGDPLDCLSPTNPDLFFVDEIYKFVGHLSSAINDQLNIIRRVFPASVNVASIFIDKIGQKVFVPYVNTLFDITRSKSTETYLRAVSGTYQQYLQLPKNITFPLDQRAACLDTLDGIRDDAFSVHVRTYLTEELAYFKRRSDAEVDGWERQLSQQDASIESLFMANVNRQADKRDFLSSFRKVVMMPVNALPAFPFGGRSAGATKTLNEPESLELPSKNSSRPMSRQSGGPRDTSPIGDSNIIIPRTPSPLAEAPTTELAAKAAIMKSKLEGIRSLFSLEVALNLVHMAKGSIDRTTVFAQSGGKFDEEARCQCETIFVMLLKTLGNRHVRIGFDQAVEHLANYNPRAITDREAGNSQGVAPLVVFLELVNVGDLIQQMLEVFYEQELATKALTDRNDFLNPTLKEKKRFEQMLDERVAAGLNKGIEVLIAEVEYICATTQRPEDYNPGASGIAVDQIVDISPTNTAVSVIDLVSSHTKMLVGSTDKNMLDVFNQEVGLRLYSTVCKHIKRQRVSVAGSIRLIRYVREDLESLANMFTNSSDMNIYFGFIQTLKNKELLQYFKALRELSQIYLIDPNDAKELATVIADTDRYLGIIRPEEVYEFAERRADWHQVKARVEKAMYGIGCALM